MKNMNSICKSLARFTLALAIAGLAWVPGQALAQAQAGEKGATKLMKIQTVDNLQSIEAGDTIVMSCPKCKETYSQVVEKTFKAVKPEEVKTVSVHLCSSCETKIVTKGVGKQAKDTLVHKCTTCGSEDVTCCVLKRGDKPMVTK